jgi:hypothetical protein
MHKEDTSCVELIRGTADSITDDVLKVLFVSIQRHNLGLCRHYAIKR